MTATPHDALFKAAFSQVVYAAEELRHVLPPELVAVMDFSTMQVEPGSFIDEALRARYTGLLYSLETIAQMLESGGMERGLQQGRQEGRSELVLRQLRRRFGELPDSVV